jgi:hypothetical protein
MQKVYSTLLLALLVLAGCNKAAPSPQEQMRDASAALEGKNFGRAAELTAAITTAEPGNTQAHYVRAQALAMFGDLDAATRSLEAAFLSGFKDFNAIDANPNLTPLRGTPQLEALLQKYDPRAAAKPTISDTEIKAGDTRIKEVNGQQVIKAGDIELTLPKD